jgi:hypothetical protein
MENKTTRFNTGFSTVQAIAILIIALSFASCASNRATLAMKCAKAYPCGDTIVIVSRIQTDTLMLPAYDQTDTISVPCPPGLTDTVMVPVIRIIHTPAKTILRKITVQDTITARIDSALRVAYAEMELKYLEAHNNNLLYQAQLKESRRASGRSWWPWVLVGLLSAGILYLVFIKKK